MAALSTGVGSLRDVFKQDGPLAAGTGEAVLRLKMMGIE